MKLAYVAHQLTGDSVDARLALARRLDLALEVADGPELETCARSGLEITTLQAFGMHALHPLHEGADERARARPYVLAVLERAARWNVPRVLTACGFHPAVADRALERCVEFYAGLSARARQLGITLLVEPLSPLRAGALNVPEDVDRLIAALDDDAFAAALDVGHLIDAEREPLDVLRRWQSPVRELQLRGARSRAPDPDQPFDELVAALAAEPEVIAIEHREPLPEPELVQLVARVRRALAF